MLDLVNKRFWFFLASVLVLLVGIISLVLFGLKPSIEFTSGSTMTLQFGQSVEQGDLREKLTELGYGNAIIQRTGEGDFFIHTPELGEGEKDRILDELEGEFGCDITALDFYSVSPIVAREIWRSAFIAIAVASMGILLYMAWAFRRMPQPFRWGSCALAALVHDVLITVGIFSILGRVANVEVDAMFIIGLLTVIGYSVNNTIVVFDRTRENLGKGISGDLSTTVNVSLVETLSRSLNTSLTTIFVLVALLLFGGSTIHNFILVLLVGLISGTYSSLCISSQLLVVWMGSGWGWPFGGKPQLATARR
jgi:preprotein translocase subunit SecF